MKHSICRRQCLSSDDESGRVCGSLALFGIVMPNGRAVERRTCCRSTTSTPSHPSPLPPVHQLPRVIALANQKGGVGKTTTTVNLGAALAEMGLRTLIIDLDPQGNASTGLGIENRGLEHSMYHVLMHEEPLENVRRAHRRAQPLRCPGVARSGRRRDRARAGVQPRTATQACDRSRSRRLRLRPDRLPAVTRIADGQRPGRGQRGAGPHPVRVLRARGSRPAASQRGPRQTQSESRRWR